MEISRVQPVEGSYFHALFKCLDALGYFLF